jgi:hypothetical protein
VDDVTRMTEDEELKLRNHPLPELLSQPEGLEGRPFFLKRRRANAQLSPRALYTRPSQADSSSSDACMHIYRCVLGYALPPLTGARGPGRLAKVLSRFRFPDSCRKET